MNTDSPLGINISKIASFGSGWAFVDVWKQAREWISQQEGQPWGEGGPLDLDDNGWVRSLPPGHYVENVVMDSHGYYPAGRYTLLYEGEGTMAWSGDANAVVEEPGRILLDVNPSEQGIWVRITRTDPANYLRNFELIMPGFERSHERQPFHPQFLKLWGRYRVLRFMDWSQTNNSSVRTWKDRTTPAAAHQTRGVALEYLVTLCNTLQADAWINVPHQADNDYVTRCATFFRDTLDPRLKIYVEYSNEVWNRAPAFIEQFNFATEQGLALDLSMEENEARLRYYARRSVEIFRIFEEVFEGVDRLVRVLAWQSAGVEAARQLLLWDDAYQDADALGIAPYLDAAFDSPPTEEEIAALTVEDILDRLEDQIPFIMLDVRQHAQHAAAMGLDLIAYEGGQHLVALQSEMLREKFSTANRHGRMREIYLEYLTHWKYVGGKTFCLYNSMSQYGRYGSWGLLEHYGQFCYDVPKFRGADQFNEIEGRWWETPATPALPVGQVLVDFDAAAMSADGVLNRPLEEIREGDTVIGSRIPFRTDAGNPLFDTGEYQQGRFYGGYQADFSPNAQPDDEPLYLLLRSNDEGYAPNRFHVRIGSGENQPSAQTVLFLWLSEDFLIGSPPFSLGKLSIELGELSPDHAELRFVLRNGEEYYLSEHVAGAPGVHELTEFNNSVLPGHRWALFQPTPTDFAIPQTPVEFAPMVFDDITAVGLFYLGRVRAYHQNFQFLRFRAHSAVPEELAAIIVRAPDQEWLTSKERIAFDAVFSAPVEDFTAEKVALRGTALPTTASVFEAGPDDGTAYRVEVSGMSTQGSVIVDIPAGAASHDGMPNRPATSLDNYVYFTEGSLEMDEHDQILGIAELGRLEILAPRRLAGRSVRLTTMAMQVSASPESEAIDLGVYEGKAILVRGNTSDGWLHSAELLDAGGPIVTALAQRFLSNNNP